MTREEVKEMLPVLQAFADGKTIQAIDPYEDEWVDQAGLNFKALFDGQYRIKLEPTYRPFKDAEECWQEMLKHQPFGWVKYADKYISISAIDSNNEYEIDFDDYTFADGTPLGIKVDE